MRSGSKRRSPGSSPTGRRRVISRALTSSVNVILRDEDMDRDEALKLLKSGEEGIREWNQRRRPGEAIPDLGGANLYRAALFFANLALPTSALPTSALPTSAVPTSAPPVPTSPMPTTSAVPTSPMPTSPMPTSAMPTSPMPTSAVPTSEQLVLDDNLRQCRSVQGKRAWSQSSTEDRARSVSTRYSSRKGRSRKHSFVGVACRRRLSTYLPSIMVVMQPIQFYSCFISYSSKDQPFAERLYADLQGKGVRCWYAPEDLKIGEKIRVGIDESIRIHDKLLLVLSKNSVASDWVEKEVETAMEKERQQKRVVLFPIRLDDAVMKIETGWPADIRRSRNIGDFKKWKAHGAYQKAFERLLRDLKAEESVGAKQD